MPEGPRNMRVEKTGADSFSVLSSASESLRKLKGHDSAIHKHEQRRGRDTPVSKEEKFSTLRAKLHPVCITFFHPPSTTYTNSDQ